MVSTLLTRLFGNKHDRDRKKLWPVVEEINRHFDSYRDLSDAELAAKTAEFKQRLAEGETLDDLLPEAFAAVKDACRRLVGRTWSVVGIDVRWDMVPYDVQLLGGVVLHQGRIAEMATGEGKTLVATMPLYLNALAGRGTHLVTVNDYLALRDSQWMGEIYKTLGLTVGVIQNQMDYAQRRQAYACDITYGTNNEFGFDYLRDNMAVRPEHRVQRGFYYAIVDEVDSVLIDEARTPLIISGPVEHSNQDYGPLKGAVERLVAAQGRLVNDYLRLAEEELAANTKEKEWDAGVHLLQVKRAAPKHKRLARLLSEKPELTRLVTRVELEFLRDKRMHELDEDLFYSVEEKQHNVDLLEKGRDHLSPGEPGEFMLPDLSEQLALLEGTEATPESRMSERERLYADYAKRNERIHNVLQLLKAYALYEKDNEYVVQDGKVLIVDEFTGRLMPGRRYSDGLHQAIEAKEGVKVEGETQTLATITLQNFFRLYDKLAGMTGTAETEAREFWEIYKLDVSVIPTNKDVVRIDENDVVFRTKREKYAAIIDEIVECHERGQPVLVGTVSVEVSELLSYMLKRKGVPHSVLNAKYHQREAEIVAEAGKRGIVTIATNMAGRGTDIKLGPDVPSLGGLHILGTERHEARRIDRQLRGRSGRQGDPGSSRFFLSLEDDLMRLFGGERIAALMTRLGVQEGEVIEHRMVTRSIENAQRKVEAHNFDIRKHLLEYDDVMNKQRTVVYEVRNRLLENQDVRDEVKEWIAERVAARAEKFLGAPGTHPEEWDLKGFAEELSFLVMWPIDVAALEAGGSREGIEETATNLSVQAFEHKVESTGGDAFVDVSRQVMLWTLDEKWRDHLYELDHLKGGIGLRAYGQRDPLLEYKKEAFELFESLLDDVREESLRRLFRIQLADAPAMPQRGPVRMTASHAEAPTAFGGAPAGDGEEGVAVESKPRSAASQSPASPSPARGALRAGRNDPCPCGSGKKYKKCHLPSDEGRAA
ncbi:MAG TPA: preprotein translocase subunit SecA [Candidatus Eisenbacteria bacterium]|nr:preprotein translocase subunit SecA [Candidatus Eisenbacteria bacterium]